MNNTITKRICSICLVLVLLVSFLPVTSVRALESETAETDQNENKQTSEAQIQSDFSKSSEDSQSPENSPVDPIATDTAEKTTEDNALEKTNQDNAGNESAGPEIDENYNGQKFVESQKTDGTADVSNTAAVPVSITVKPPQKTTYIQNQENLDLTYGEIKVTYEDGTEKTVPLSDGEITGFSNAEPGTYTLTVTYLGLENTFDISIVGTPAPQENPGVPDPPAVPEKDITSIWVKAPSQTSYFQYEKKLRVDGGEVWVTYEDGSEEIVLMTETMVTGFNTDKAGSVTLTVTYGGCTATFDITVRPGPQPPDPPKPPDPSNPDIEEIYGISVKQKPTKLQYILNQDTLDLTGGVIEIYTNVMLRELPMDISMATGFDNTQLGICTITITYKGQTATFPVGIVEENSGSIILETNITSWPRKTCYYLGESLDMTDAEATRLYSDGTTEVLPITSDMVTGFDSSQLGYQWITVQLDAWERSIRVEVIEREEFSGYCGPDILWELDSNGNLYLTGSGPMNFTGGRVPWREHNDRIRSVYIGEGIESLGDGAFFHIAQLARVELPESLLKIGDSAFAESGIHSIHIPDHVTEIGRYAFGNCDSLESVGLPQQLTCLEEAVFQNCRKLREIHLPDGLTEIGYFCFDGCESLQEITFPETLEALYSNAFQNCTGLQKITFTGEPLNYRGNNIFDGVTAKAYYPAVKGWNNSFHFELGGNLEWINTSKTIKAESLKISLQPIQSSYGIGDSIYLNIQYEPSFADTKFRFDIQGNSVIRDEHSTNSRDFRAVKQGISIVTVTDEISNLSDDVEIYVEMPEEIRCPADFTVDPAGRSKLEYTFTPEISGDYIISTSINYYPYVEVYEKGNQIFGSFNSGPELQHMQFNLDAGISYKLVFNTSWNEGYDPIEGLVRIKLDQPKNITSLKIKGGDVTCYSAPGEEFYTRSFRAILYPEGSVGEISWSTDRADIFQLDYGFGYDAYGRIKGDGPIKVTASCGDYSDSITIQTKRPEPISEDTLISVSLDPQEERIYSFTPKTTGQYVLEFTEKDYAYSCYFCGKYSPENEKWNSSGDKHYTYGGLTAGTTYYLSVGKENMEPGSEKASILIRKMERKPSAIEITPVEYSQYTMILGVNFLPENSFEKIVEWESSDPSILEFHSKNNTQSQFFVMGKGQVTVTATSESGKQAKYTLQVGACTDGHKFGPWVRTKDPTCILSGTETSTCQCGLSQYRTVPAVGHTYDNNCDTKCNICGAERKITHTFSDEWIYDIAGHWHVCTICGEKTGYENHTPGPKATEKSPQVCTECGYVIHPALGHQHSFSSKWSQSESAHWHECSGCGSRKDYHVHVYSGPCDDTCNVCRYIRVPEHAAGGKWISDRGGHWQICSNCGKKLMYHEHVPGRPATSTQAQKCVICGQVLEEARKDDSGGKETIKETVIYRPSGGHTHQYDDKLTMDQTGHWYPCKGCNGRKDFEAHTYDNLCDSDCNTCGYRREVIHNRDPEPKADETGHWYTCKDCGEKLDFEPHRFSEGKCLVCGYEDPNYQETEPTVLETTALVTNVSESADNTTSQGAPWWVVVLACIAGSAVTLGGGVLIIWLNRKKIIDLLTNRN